MLQCKCSISTSRALHVDQVCAFCYSNNELVIKHTHTQQPFLTVALCMLIILTACFCFLDLSVLPVQLPSGLIIAILCVTVPKL